MTEEPVKFIHIEESFVVVEKASGFLSVPGKGEEKSDCAVARVRSAIPGCIEHPEVHRLDMDTSGLLVMGLTRESQRHLSLQFQNRQTFKEYVALLDGLVDAEGGTIELPFRLDIHNRPYQVYDEVHGKLGVTHWRKWREENGHSRVRMIPVTGRTHQLRVHAAHPKGLGIPIVGDPLYGRGTGPGQLKLHAAVLAFSHPLTGVACRFQSEPCW